MINGICYIYIYIYIYIYTRHDIEARLTKEIKQIIFVVVTIYLYIYDNETDNNHEYADTSDEC